MDFLSYLIEMFEANRMFVSYSDEKYEVLDIENNGVMTVQHSVGEELKISYQKITDYWLKSRKGK